MNDPARRPSLTRHLLAWALGALVLVWGSFILVGYKTGEHEADELTDGHLASVSSLLLPLVPGGLANAAAPATAPTPQLRAHDYQRSMSVLLWDAAGRLVSRTGDVPAAPFETAEGFATLHLGNPPQPWRAFTRWDAQRSHKLMVLLSARERDDLADDIAQQVSEPGLWLLPVVALLLALAIHRGLRPLRKLAHDVHALDIQAPRGMVDPARYEELQASVEAVNHLVERYQAALARERELANEFAHELRTPLAALALQAGNARDAGSPQALQSALAQVQEQALRAGEVLNHLLALARASRAALDEAAQPVDLHLLAQRVVAEFAPAADAGGRTLGLESSGSFPLKGHPVLLELALRNLVENALAHTPPATEVAVELDSARRWIQVSDDGRTRRSVGDAVPAGVAPLRLGLGLKVVERVAALHGGAFEADVPLPGGRHAWRIRFPAVREQADAAQRP
jgi:two-component system sensor histidine kinase QseC